MTQTFKTERESWDMLRGPRKRRLRRHLAWRLHKLTPNPRRVLEDCVHPEVVRSLSSEPYGKYLPIFHPRAFALLLRYGKKYTPLRWNNPPPFGEPLDGGCGANAWRLMHLHNSSLRRRPETVAKGKHPMVYVEGLALGSVLYPMLHAWNARGREGCEAIDWTFYAGSAWIHYWGVPFTRTEAQTAFTLIAPAYPRAALLFERENFTRVEDYLTQLLAKRAARGSFAEAA